MAKRVLVVDDEKLIVKGLSFSLEQDGMEVDTAFDGEEAYEKAMQESYDVILLDVMLPKMDGMEVCRKIRETSHVPIVMLTAKGEDMDKILGLEYGADDYITKPFNILEVKARLKAIMRRTGQKEPSQASSHVITCGDVTMDTQSRRFILNGEEYTNLTSREFDIMLLFIRNPGKVYNRDELLAAIWGADYPGDARTVDVHIRRLREKIEPKPSDPRYVCTKWGMGYYYKQ